METCESKKRKMLEMAAAGDAKGLKGELPAGGEASTAIRSQLLHSACGKQVVDLLVDTFGEECLLDQTEEGLLPIHSSMKLSERMEETALAIAIRMSPEDLCKVTSYGTIMHMAVHEKNISLVKALFELQPRLVTVVDSDGRHPCCLAVALEQEVKIADTKGAWMAEHLFNLRPLVDFLIEETSGEDLMRLDTEKRTALHYASTEPTTRLLLVKMGPGAAVMADGQGGYPIHYMAFTSSFEAARVASFAMPRAELLQPLGDSGCTALHLACDTFAEYKGGISISNLELFLELMPEAQGLPSSKGLSPLHYALRMRYFPHIILRMLAHTPAELLEARWEDGKTLLHHAAHYGYPDVVEALLERMPATMRSLTATDEGDEGKTALDLAKDQLEVCGVEATKKEYERVVALLVRASPP